MIEKGRIVSHPGVYIKDAIDELGLTQSEFALRSGLSIKNVSTIINGESDITFDAAVKLSNFFHNSVEGWINLQTKYDLFLRETKRKQEYEDDWKVAKLFDKNFVSSCLGIRIEVKNKETVIDELRKGFNVGNLINLKHVDMYVFCKTSVKRDLDEKTIIMRNAWISLAEQEARNISCQPFNKDILSNNIRYLRTLTLLEPKDFQPKLKRVLAEAGIKLVILPFLPGSNVSGITKWIENEQCVMVAINDCGKDADKIWFAIFHELGHAMQNHKRHMTISYRKGEIEDKEENEANEFAKNSLINQRDYDSFVNKRMFDLRSIQKFAKEQQVADFIVIGRLQKEEYVPWNKFQSRKIKYVVDF